MPTEPFGSSRFVVVHVVKGLGPGGAERLILNQLLTRDTAGFDYRVIRLIGHKDHLVTDIRSAGVDVYETGYGPAWPVKLAGLLRRGDVDIVHVHSPLVAGIVRLLRLLRIIDAIVVTTEHNRWPRHHRLTRLLNRLTMPIDDATIAVSADVRSSIDSRLQHRATVVRHGIPVSEIARARARRDEIRDELGLVSSQVVVGIVANFRPEKAYDTFLAAAVVAADRDPDLHFVVVGQGPGEDDFRRQVVAAGLSDRITVTGYRVDATAVMSAFDVFTLSSRHEGLPVSLMEAKALGLPAVATRAGGIPEAVRPDHDGLLVDIDDSAALAEGWLALAGDADRRRVLGQAARESADSFDCTESTSEIESLYRRLMTGSG